MKKRFLLAASMVLLFSMVKAQGLHYGVKADLNLFQLDGQGIQSHYNFGGRLGVYANYDFNKQWGIQPELLYAQENTRRDNDFSERYIHNSNPTASKNVKLSYLTLPLLLRYNINRKFTINAGPQYSFLVYENDDLLTYNKNAFKRSDFGVAAGATMTFDILHIYARYVLGLTNVNDIDDRYPWKTRQAQIGIDIDIK
ncbi:porin family protein [Chitinophaga sp. 30R24]|uniref:porin family protein n=1 Tax=Chitinophaga sp. 30R24 TaxID=3248838 RepID=UPI003B8ECAC8